MFNIIIKNKKKKSTESSVQHSNWGVELSARCPVATVSGEERPRRAGLGSAGTRLETTWHLQLYGLKTL